MEKRHLIPTAWGDVQIFSRGSGLSRLLLPQGEKYPSSGDDPPAALASAITAYFAGQPISFRMNFGDQQLDDMYQRAAVWWQENPRLYSQSPIPELAVDLDLSSVSPYIARVLAATAAIPWGQTISYIELGYLVSGDYRHARAVGSAMRYNPLPLIIPCHRVLAKNGPGGFSGGTGIDYKLKMLDLERKQG